MAMMLGDSLAAERYLRRVLSHIETARGGVVGASTDAREFCRDITLKWAAEEVQAAIDILQRSYE